MLRLKNFRNLRSKAIIKQSLRTIVFNACHQFGITEAQLRKSTHGGPHDYGAPAMARMKIAYVATLAGISQRKVGLAINRTHRGVARAIATYEKMTHKKTFLPQYHDDIDRAVISNDWSKVLGKQKYDLRFSKNQTLAHPKTVYFQEERDERQDY